MPDSQSVMKGKWLELNKMKIISNQELRFLKTLGKKIAIDINMYSHIMSFKT